MRTRALVTWVALGLTAGAVVAQDRPAPLEAPTLDEGTLRERIADITVADVAWRAIPWKPCLLDGLAAARREKKPVLVWCQIDRPADDTRC